MASNNTLKLHQSDNVAIVLHDMIPGDNLSIQGQTTSSIPAGHKVCVQPIANGDAVIKYGQIIGLANTDIAIGEHVHIHNLGMGDHKQGYDFASAAVPVASVDSNKYFDGYHRASGKVGTRNYIGIMTTVNCSGTVAKLIAEAAEKAGLLDEYRNIDGVVPIVHGMGCGMAASGEGFETLQRTLNGYAENPNFAGILLVGLGCEVMQIKSLTGPALQESANFKHLTIQQAGGTRQSIEQGLEALKALAVQANKTKRKPAPISELVVGMQCGGSDGYSGITANPSLGAASDLLIRHGGTTILSETPEIYGAEHLLTRRAISTQVGEKLIARIKWWEDYCVRNFSEMNNNPSPGNKRGGLTTILEKSLGAVAKAGTAPLNDVLKYAEPVTTRGLVFMDSPGYDPCSVTGQIASGATLICFTTGRGSVSGYKPSPCIKLATNTEMYERMSEDMDINCGEVINGSTSIEEQGALIFQFWLDVASGKQSKSEELGFGGAEFVPWQIGAVM